MLVVPDKVRFRHTAADIDHQRQGYALGRNSRALVRSAGTGQRRDQDHQRRPSQKCTAKAGERTSPPWQSLQALRVRKAKRLAALAPPRPDRQRR